ncbi:hypothetical protein I862_05015 [endosymbiont of Acanthamoeba sp. UWC8]|uniref:DUF2339 domain-containing protein n=1 Tax=endosymbiont of Acanthamoeba sp. UWC8 TaxID=86106 RepID=UPI0004D1CABC|nr:DUF2339 domain-containing protein [endosymbiont of Acanthamoeba sp. UWC8]AIF81559.1 hypothetical protein I862_05015 [endosymbiont of Acanthamoeba sp. UWC8]
MNYFGDWFSYHIIIIISIIVTWLNYLKISSLEKQISFLKNELQRVLTLLKSENKTFLKENLSLKDESLEEPKAGTIPSHQQIREDTVSFNTLHQEIPKDIESSIRADEEVNEKIQPQESFEHKFGTKLSVWIGGIALILAVFYMVKYSIELGLVTPAARVLSGIFFGIGMLYIGHIVREKTNLANGKRIAQACSGAGIASLYICIFSAVTLYNLIPVMIGLTGMTIITLTAIILSLGHGAPIAILGLVGGFLTPIMVGIQGIDTPVMFLYLYFVLTGLMVVIKKQYWWFLAVPVVLCAFLWVIFWLFAGYTRAFDTIWLSLFLIAISGTIIALSKDERDSLNTADIKSRNNISALNYFTIGGALSLMAVITTHSNFSAMEWGLFGLLSLGTICLAYFNQKLYGKFPFISCLISIALLWFWNYDQTSHFIFMILLFSLIYMGSSYFLQWESRDPRLWGLLFAVSSIGYYIVSCYNINFSFSAGKISYLWGGIALLPALLAFFIFKQVQSRIPENHPYKEHVSTIYAALCTAFISISFAAVVSYDSLHVAIALQMMFVAWINTRTNIKALKHITTALAFIFGALIIPKIFAILGRINFHHIFNTQFYESKNIDNVGTFFSHTYGLITLTACISIWFLSRTFKILGLMLITSFICQLLFSTWPIQGKAIAEAPLFHLGLPALCFLVTNYLLPKEKNGALNNVFDVATVALLSLTSYCVIRYLFQTADQSFLSKAAGFLERGIITNLFLVIGLASIFLGKHENRRGLILSGLTLYAISVFRICCYDLIIYNPLYSSQPVGGFLIFNSLLIVYALPIFWIRVFINNFPLVNKNSWVSYGYALMMILSFAYVTLNIRQFFQGSYLNGFQASNTEIYTYSIVWLIFGLGLLFLGTMQNDRMIRISSLIVMAAVIGKVFLYDAGELSGLYRVFSFFGLGFSLLGLSWFYTKFVLNTAKET